MLSLGVKAGDRVIIPSYSCVALANAALAVGAVPVAADIQPGSWNIDPVSVQHAIHEHDPALIIAVHTFGRPADITALKSYGIPVLEDCSHAFGITSSGHSIGSQGAAAAISLHATKLIAGGEGGCLLTNDSSTAGRARDFSEYADQDPSRHRLNDRITECSAAIATSQLEHLEEMLSARVRLAARYQEKLAGLQPALRLPTDGTNAWYRYVVECQTMTAREASHTLAQHAITALEPVDDWRDQESRERSPNASRAYRSLLSLPLYPTLTPTEQDRVIQAVYACFHK
jgi:dTDP-4-amino-4,6-dideoxygalactose transaminase